MLEKSRQIPVFLSSAQNWLQHSSSCLTFLSFLLIAQPGLHVASTKSCLLTNTVNFKTSGFGVFLKKRKKHSWEWSCATKVHYAKQKCIKCAGNFIYTLQLFKVIIHCGILHWWLKGSKGHIQAIVLKNHCSEKSIKLSFRLSTGLCHPFAFNWKNRFLATTTAAKNTDEKLFNKKPTHICSGLNCRRVLFSRPIMHYATFNISLGSWARLLWNAHSLFSM